MTKDGPAVCYAGVIADSIENLARRFGCSRAAKRLKFLNYSFRAGS